MATATALGFSLFSTWDPKGARQARKDLTGLQKVTRDLGAASAVAFGGAVLGVTAYAAALLKAGIASNDLQQRSNAALKTTLGSTRAAAEQMQKLRDFGQGSPIQLPVWIKAQQQMLAFGVEAGKVVPLLGAVQDAVIAAGGTEEEIKGVVRALSQMQSKGKLSAEELNQIGERGIDAAGVVAQAFGTTAEDIRARITQGTISVDDFFDGFIKGSEMAFGGAAELAKQTFSGMIDRLKGAHRRIGEILATPLVDPEGGGALVELGNALADAMNNLEDALRPVVATLSEQLDPAVDRAADSIRKFGESITPERIFEFIDTIKNGLPVLSAFSAMLSAKLASGFLELLPGMQRLKDALSPVLIGIAALAATSPEFRSALQDIGDALRPLVPVAAALATVVAEVLTNALKVLLPVLTAGVSVIKFMADNLGTVVPVIIATGGALYYMAAAHGVNTAATAAAALAGVRLKEAFIALRGALVAHPLLLIATVITGVFVAFNMARDAALAWRDDVKDAFTQVASGAETFNEAIAHVDMEKLANNFRATWAETRRLGEEMNNGVGIAEVWNAVTGQSSDELIRLGELSKMTAEDTQLLDNAMAAMVRGGQTTEGVLLDVQRALGFSGDEMQRLVPQLVQFETAAVAMAEASREELTALATEAGSAMAAVRGLGDEMKAQTDPYFGLIKAANDYSESLEKWEEASGDAASSQSDIENAAVKVAESMLALQIAGEGAGALFSQGLPDDFRIMAEAMGLPEGAMSALESAFSEDSQSILASAEQMTSQGITHMAGFMAMISELSVEQARTTLGVKKSVDSLIAGGMSYAEAIRFMADETGMSTAEIEENFGVARAAGLDFSDDYPAHIRLTGQETFTAELDGIVQTFLDRSTSIQGYIDELIGKGYEYEDALRIVAGGTGLSLEEVESYYEGAKKSVTNDLNGIGGGLKDLRGAQTSTKVNTAEFTASTIDSYFDMAAAVANRIPVIGGLLGTFIRKMGDVRSAASTMVKYVMDGWGRLKETARTAWTSIKNSISRPVNFVVGTLYNDGLVNMWNRVSAAMFGNKGKLSAVKGFASGAYIRGPGTGTSDSIPARLSNGEYVVRAAAVQKYGVGTFDALNNMQVEQPRGFFLGGLVDLAGKGISKTFNWLNDNAKPDWMSGVFDIMGSVDKMIDGMKSKFFNIPADMNSKKFRDMLASGAKTIWSRVTKVWETVTGSLGGMGGGPGGYQQMFQWIKGIVPGTQLTSGFRQGDPGYHGRGMAVDLAFSDGSERRGGGKAETAYNAIKRAWMAGIAELIWDYSPDGYGVGVWNGRRHKFNSASSRPPSHNDHIHWAQSGSGGGGGGSAGGWSHVATAALKAAGLFSSSNLANVLRAIQKESSGNPRAVNNWDINARNGTPSKGLLQTIDPTFYSYAGKYRDRGPFDPFANIYAAARYASSRYGSGWSARMARPGGYAAGGAVSYDSGGMLQPGYTLAYNGTGKPEPVGHDLKGSTTVNIDMRGAVIANERQFEDMVVKAMTKASEKNRLRNIKVKR